MIRPTGRRSAFTLVELLVVIAIITILMSMLLPAVQKVREAANAMVCASQMRQIAIGIHNYHNDFKKLPAGMYNTITQDTGWIATEGPYAGMICVLLPYIEQDALRQAILNPPATSSLAISLTSSSGAPWWDPAFPGGVANVGIDIAQVKIKFLRCPSDSSDKPVNTLMATIAADAGGAPSPYENYAVDGVNRFPVNNFGLTNYFGVAGMTYEGNVITPGGAPYRSFDGLFQNRTNITLGQLTAKDGTSNTLMLGESVGGVGLQSAGTKEDMYCWLGAGALTTYRGLAARNVSRQKSGPSHERFSSAHTAGVQFIMGDTALKTVRRENTFNTDPLYAIGTGNPQNIVNNALNGTVEWRVLQMMAGWKDGERYDVDVISD